MNYVAKHRVEAFSDGVFAISVTRLVLGIEAPKLAQPASAPELARALLPLLPKVLSWMVSFLMVCVVWVNHHRLLSQIGTLTHGVFWLNANLLLWCSFIPFPTALLGDYPTNPVSAVVFGGVMALLSLSFTLLRLHVQRRPRLLAPGLSRAWFRRSGPALLLGPGLHGAGAAAAFISPWLALAVFGFVPLYFIFFNAYPSVVASGAPTAHE